MRKWAVKRKKGGGANDQEVSNVEEVADVVHVQEVTGESSISTTDSAFSCRQSLHQSLSRADLHLPKGPNKNAEINQRLATKYNRPGSARGIGATFEGVNKNNCFRLFSVC